MTVKALSESQTPEENLAAQSRISTFKYIFLITYVVNFAVIAGLFFDAYISGYRYPSYSSPIIVCLWCLLSLRFVLDTTIMVVFSQHLVFFIKMKKLQI